ncbi:MAG: VCBS repeat-containing protein [Bacteroidota bacterium]
MNRILIIVVLISTLACQSEQPNTTLFQELPSTTTNIHFINTLAQNDTFNIIEYLYFYNGGGIAAGDINNDGLLDLYFTSNQGLDRLYLNKGDLAFEDITEQTKVGGETGIHKWTTSASMVDINQDGWLDIYVCEVANYKILKGKNRLYINQGDLTFKEAGADYNLDISTYSQQAAFLDYDVDGDLDLFLLNHAVHTPDSYKRASVRTIRDSLAGDRLYRNDNGRFVEVTEEAGIYSGVMGYGLSVSVGDLNNDRLPDIYVTNDFHENDYLYFNQGDGAFQESIKEVTGHLSTFAMGSDIADFNNDGWLDILTMDMKPDQEPILKSSAGVDPYEIYRYKLSFGYHDQYSRNALQLNRGQLPNMDNIRFSEIGQYAGIAATDWSWSSLFVDFDNDGKKDIFVSNGIPKRPNDLDYIRYLSNGNANAPASEMIQNMPDGSYPNFAFQNQGLQFEDVSANWGLDKKGYSNGAIYADLDHDGDLDLVLNNWGEKASVFENRTAQKVGNNWLQIQLKGDTLNPNGIGARLEIFCDREMQVSENQMTKGWLSSINSSIVHFGLGEKDQIDSIVIKWTNRKQQTLRNVSPNQVLEVTIENAKTVKQVATSTKNPLFQLVQNSGINFQHQETFFNDFANEKLIPHLMSTEGSSLSIGDVNADGLEDFHIGGAKGQAGELYLQQENGTPFKKQVNAIFEEHRAYEDVASTFFDADQDGDLDLYVVSGSTEQPFADLLQDRLYINDGSGNFKSNQLPDTRFNGSCVVPLDMNEDGKKDLFIGNRGVKAQYGNFEESQLLINKGDGQFEKAFYYMDTKFGMVTDAIWLEEQHELWIVGEWMRVKRINFSDQKEEAPQLLHSGWWNSVAATDINEDGQLEILLGNKGLNTNLTASKDQPLELFVDDYDENSSSDPIMAYHKNGKQWVYPDLDVLAKQIVSVRKNHQTYEDYAQSTFSEVFPKRFLENSTQHKIETLASAYLDLENGEYLLKPLPGITQWSSIQDFATADFDQDGKAEILAVGNFYGNTPSIGRSDASFGHYLDWEDNQLMEKTLQEVGFAVEGESRAIGVLSANGKAKFVLVARNDAHPVLFEVSR